MRTAWTWTVFGLLLLALSLVIVTVLGADNRALSPGVIGLAAAACGALLLLLWFVPKLQVRRLDANATEHFNAENEARKSLAQIFGGIAFLATFYVSWANYNIAADKEVTETFGNAVEQLSKSDVSVRIGGAYILERLSKSSPKDYDGIMSILTHAVQDHGQRLVAEKSQATTVAPVVRPPEAPGDVETIVRILGRRQKLSTSTEDALNLEGSDLSGVRGRNLHLEWAYLVHTRLQGVYLYGVHFENAQLVGADANVFKVPKPDATAAPGIVDRCLDPDFFTHTLVSATFSCGHFNQAVLVNGDFEEATFNNADLRGAKLSHGDFRRAHFNNANLSQADLTGADLSGADLSTAVGMTDEQWRSATTDDCTRKPRFDTDASMWKAPSCEDGKLTEK